MPLTLESPPAAEPVDVPTAKSQLRIDIADDDALITAYIKAARTVVEQKSLHALITQTWDLYLDAFPSGKEIEIPLPPLQSVTHIRYIDEDGNESTFSSDDYLVDTVSTPGKVVLKDDATWPSESLQEVNGVVVRFVAGFGDAGTDVDERAIQAVKLLVGHFYEHREAFVDGRPLNDLPMGVDALLADLRAKAKKF